MEILSDELTSYISRTKDYRIIYDMVLETGDPTSFIVPYRTRFNSSQRANRSLGQFYDVMETAALNYDTAVLVTLTTDPAKHESLWDAIQAIGQNFTRLQQWLAYEPKNKESTRPGRRLPFVKVLEFTGGSRESTYPGLPHLHVLFFDVDRRSDGMPFLMDKQELASKWDDLGQGRIVQLTPFCFETDLDKDVYGTDNGFVCWGSNDEQTDQDFERSTTAERYLSKYIGQLSALASEADEIDSGGGLPDDSQLELYKLAMYWVTGRQVWSCSKSLRESAETPTDIENTQTAEVTVTFAGCYHKDDIPVSTLLNSRQVNPVETRRMGDGSYQWLVSEEVIGTG